MLDDIKKTLWATADKLRANMDAAEYKHLVLGLIFLKFISDTVRDVIQFEANIAGAVHAGAARTEKEKALETVAKSIGIGGHAPTLRQLLAIARVSVKALSPLRAAVNAT